MAGKKGDKDAKKKEVKAAKQAAKTAKSTKKKALKNDDEEHEEDIEKILAALAAEDAKKTVVHVNAVDRPSARANSTVTPLPSGELVVFGGEFWNGQHNTCYNELFRYTPGDNVWKMVTSPHTPPPRCSHQACLVNSGGNYQLFLYGGEFATNVQFYHYNDTWKLDLTSNRWARVECKKSPSARSGHRMVTWRNYVVLFGGFHQSYTSDVWHKDLWLLDTRTNEWKEVVIPTTAQQPTARSGMQFHVIPGRDCVLLYGGYSEVKNVGDAMSIAAVGGGGGGGKGKGGGGGGAAAAAAAALLGKKSRSVVHTDMWILRLAPVLTGGVPTWERIRYSGSAPTPRLGFAMTMYRDRAIVFGGVSDKDEDERGENVVSSFCDDMYSFDVDRRRWYKLELKKAKATGTRRAKGGKGASGGKTPGGGVEDDDAISLGSEGDEEDEEESELRLANAAIAKAHNALDDEAFYYYHDGKLVRMEMEPEDEGDGAKEEGGGEKAVHESTPHSASVVAVAPTSAVSATPVTAGGGGGGEVYVVTPTPSAALTSPAASEATPSASRKKSKKKSGHFELEEEEGAKRPLATGSSSSTGGTPSASSVAGGGSSGEKKKAAPAVAGAGVVATAGGGDASTLSAPAARMKPALWADGHWLYVLGGMAEGRVREITYDDMWRIDLRDRLKWECVFAARPHDWKGDVSDDEESEGSDEEDDEEDDDSEESGGESGGGESGSEGEAARTPSATAGAGAGMAKHARGRTHGSSADASRIRELRATLGLEDASCTPQPGEKLMAFYTRTGEKWLASYIEHHMVEGERAEGKQLRRKAFGLARARYDEVWPTLEELFELEEEQRKMEEQAMLDKKSRRPGGGAGTAKGKGR